MKSFLMRKMLASKLKDIPADQQEKVLSAIEKNPDAFQAIAKEVQEKIKQGKDQMTATMEVMEKHKDTLKDLL